MPIALTFDTREAVPEALKDHVAEKDGKFIFEAEPLSVVADTNGKLKKLRADLDAKTAKLGRFAKFDALEDAELEELHTLRELKKAGKPLTVDEKAELERLHAKQTGKLTTELAARDEKLTAAERELKHYKLTAPLRNVALKAGVLPEDLDVVMLETSSRFKLGEDSKQIITLDEDGDESDVTPKDFFEKLYKARRPKFYAGSGAGGSGAQNNTTGGKSGSHTLSRADAKDPAKYRRAKEAAEKAGQELVILE